MKKFFSILLIVVSVFALTGCEKKVALEKEQFTDIMEKEKFTIIDAAEQFADFKQVKTAYIAQEENANYQIEFYVLDSNESAIDFYNTNKTKFEESANSVKSTSEVNLANYNKYIQTNNDKYKVISRIDKTAIYLNVDKKYKAEVEEIIEKLGY